MRCSNCTNDNAPERVVCELCGYPLGPATPAGTALDSAVPAPSQKRHTQYDPGRQAPPTPTAVPPGPAPGQKRHTEYSPPGGPTPATQQRGPQDVFSTPLPPRPPIANGDDPFGQAVRQRSAEGAPPNMPPVATPIEAPPRRHGTVIEPTGPAAASPAIRGVLVEYRGPTDPGRVHALRAGRNKVGRGPECDVAVDDGRVSGDHGYVFLKADRATFIDHSTNGSIVDGQPVHGEQVEVRHGTVFRLGGSRLVLLLVPPGS